MQLPKLAALCALALTLPLAAQPDDATLRVGSWNLEHFGRRDPPRTTEQLDALAARIRELGVDALAVQEVDGAKPLLDLCTRIGPDWHFVIGTTGTFSGDPGQIGVGFLWNDARLELVQAEELLDLPREQDGLPIFHRVPVAAVFRSRQGGFDFRAITVHLKASPGDDNERKRCAEVGQLADHLRELYARADEDRDVLVLGDFNHTYGAPAFEVFTTDQTVAYLRPAQPSPTIVHFDDPIDHVAVTTGVAEDVIPGSFRVHSAEALANRELWRSTYSDHVPVTVDLRATPDRDPDASFTATTHRLGRDGAAIAVAAESAEAAVEPEEPEEPEEPSSDPFTTGAKVVVRYLDPMANKPTDTNGTLADSLDEWVVLITTEGTIAIPRERVLMVWLRND